MADNGTQSVDDQLEKEHFIRVCNAFKFYRTHSHRRINDSESSFRALPKHHQEMVPDFLENLETIRTCVDHNYEIIKLILQDAEYMFENQTQEIMDEDEDVKKTFPTAADMDKVRTTLKQFVRDWSPLGQQERDACYRPVIEEIKNRFPSHQCERSSVKILIPGAGLGRLALEFTKLGFTCQGNEWSLYMLLASNFILNKCREENSLLLYPWVHQWSNNKYTEDQTRPARLPDINPAEIPEDSNFSMAAGDFLDVYTEPDDWDCVATVFFLDTARNVIAYVETIWKILQPGGYWVNLGPLLYHYADMPDENSIELSYEQVKKVIIKTGFQYEKEVMDVKSSYTQSADSMFQYQYNSVFFVVRKPL